MTGKNSGTKIFQRAWKFFTSVKLTVFVLFFLAATSIIGTLIPQNASMAFYHRKYGEVFSSFFSAFDIFDMYHSWWFLSALGLLAVNIIICSIDRLKLTWKIIFPEKISFNLERFRRIKEKQSFVSSEKTDVLEKKYKSFLTKKIGAVTEKETENGFALFAEKGRWTRLGVYVIHFSIILLLCGAVIGDIWGFKGFVSIPEGDIVTSISRSDNRGKNKKIDLGFSVRCNSFDVSFYDTGQPKEFKSNLTLIDHDKPVLTRDVLVNHPLRYRGISIYQASYGIAAAKNVNFIIKSRDSGMVYTRTMHPGQSIALPEAGGKFIFDAFVQGYDFRGHNLGESFVGRVVDKKGKMNMVAIPVKFPSFDRMRGGKFSFSVEKFKKKYYTGLQVNKDPGVWYVYSGFIFMILGSLVTFFMSHQTICIEVIKKDKRNHDVLVSGKTNRNSQGMKLKTAGLAAKMRKL